MENFMNFSKKLDEVIWSDWFWFPEGSSWANLTSTDPNVYYPRHRDLHWSLVIGVFLVFIRQLYERFLVGPFGIHLGLKARRSRAPHYDVLEQYYKKHPRRATYRDDVTLLENLGKKLDWPTRKVERWLRIRRVQDKPSVLKKFRECSWHLVFYSLMFVWGLYVLHAKPWFWDTRHCWIGWPNQPIDRDIYWYYLIETGFYWSLLFSVLTDHKRKDFAENVVHHFSTMTLLYFSWTGNYIRVGTLVLLLHDVADPWINAAKMANYADRHRLTEVCFGILCLLWLLTRLLIYPFWILRTATFELAEIIGSFMAHKVMCFFLYVLLILNIMWGVSIFRIAMQELEGQIQKDVRSDSEVESELDTDEAINQNGSSGDHAISNNALHNDHSSVSQRKIISS